MCEVFTFIFSYLDYGILMFIIKNKANTKTFVSFSLRYLTPGSLHVRFVPMPVSAYVSFCPVVCSSAYLSVPFVNLRSAKLKGPQYELLLAIIISETKHCVC